MNNSKTEEYPQPLVCLYIVRRKGKYGFIDQTGKEVIPCKFDGVESFSEGLAMVYIEDVPFGEYGYIDKTGRVVIPFTRVAGYYESFHNGLAKVLWESDGHWGYKNWGYIDKTGSRVF